MRLLWAQEDVDYIRRRSDRYPGAMNIEPEWTDEALADAHLVKLEPYPRSRIRATGYIGFSPSAGKVLTIIAYSDLDGDVHGINAWPASGRDLTTYREAADTDEEP